MCIRCWVRRAGHSGTSMFVALRQRDWAEISQNTSYLCLASLTRDRKNGLVLLRGASMTTLCWRQRLASEHTLDPHTLIVLFHAPMNACFAPWILVYSAGVSRALCCVTDMNWCFTAHSVHDVHVTCILHPFKCHAVKLLLLLPTENNIFFVCEDLVNVICCGFRVNVGSRGTVKRPTERSSTLRRWTLTLTWPRPTWKRCVSSHSRNSQSQWPVLPRPSVTFWHTSCHMFY